MRISDWSADVCSTDLWRALCQLSANLLAGRAHQLRRPPQQAVEFCEMSRLIIVSNRVQQPVAEGAGNQGGLAVALSAALRNTAASGSDCPATRPGISPATSLFVPHTADLPDRKSTPPH